MSAYVHLGQRIKATDVACYVHEVELFELVRRHGLDPKDVAWIEHDVIDMPLLRAKVYRKDDAGRRYPLEDGETVAHDIVETPFVGDLPWWWNPETEVHDGGRRQE